MPSCLSLLSPLLWIVIAAPPAAETEPSVRPQLEPPSAESVLSGLREFYARTARRDGSFQPGIDPEYQGMSDAAYSDLAAVTYAVTLHKSFGWKLPQEATTIAWLLARQRPTGEFFNVGGTVDPGSPQGKVYNTTQALVALRALGVTPKYDPLPIFEEILKADYKTLPAYSTSFFPLAYLCAGKPIPAQADRAIRALMIQDEDGYLNDHIAATFHASHYYALVGDPTPKRAQMVQRVIRDQAPDGSWFLNQPARDRHATFDAVFTLKHEGDPGDKRTQAAIRRAAEWALSCRNADGGFGHYPGQVSDADAIYFQVGALVMADFLPMATPLPPQPELLSWGHAMPVTQRPNGETHRIWHLPAAVAGIGLSPSGDRVAAACGNGEIAYLEAFGNSWISTVSRHTGGGLSAAISPNGAWVASGGVDRAVRLAHLPSEGKLVAQRHTGAVLAVAFSPSGDLLASGSIDGTVRLWEVQTGDEVRVLKGHRSWVNAVAFNADGTQLVSGSSDGTVRIWDVKTGEPQKSLAATKAEVRSVAWSADGKWIAAGIRYGQVRWWSAETWQEAKSVDLQTDDVSAILISPDNRRVLAGTGEWNRPGRVEILDLATGASLARLSHTGEVLSLSQSRDGRVVAAGGGDRAVGIWRLEPDGLPASHHRK